MSPQSSRSWRVAALLVSVWLLQGPPAHADPAKPIVAVFDMENRGTRLSPRVMARLTDYLATRLAASGAFAVVPRDQLKKRLTGQKLASYKACYQQSCQIEIGRELAAQKTLATQVMKIGKKCVVTSTLFDLKTSASEAAATAEGPCTEDGIMTAAQDVAERVAASKAAPSGGPDTALDPRSGWLGVIFAPSAKGVIALEIVRNGPAAKAGLRAGDRALSLGETPITSALQVTRLVNEAKGGERLKLRVLRGEAAHTLEVSLLERSQAQAVCQRACSQGDAAGCRYLSLLLRRSKAPEAMPQAFRSAARACQLGSKQSCADKALMMVKGEGTRKDLAGGKRLLQETCDQGDGKSCNTLGDVLREELRGATPAERKAASPAIFEAYRKACASGNFFYGCFSFGLMQEKRDPAQAAALYQKACDAGEVVGCSNLGWLIYNGRGIAKDLFKGMSLLRRGCREKHGFACDMLKAIGVKPD